MQRESDPYTDLLRDLTSTIVLKTGTCEQIAMRYAAAAMDCLQDRKAANGSVYVGAAPRQVDVLQIKAALERGETVGRVCRAHGLSRASLYRLFPGGLPEPKEDAVSGFPKV